MNDDELEQVASQLAQINQDLRQLMQVCSDGHMAGFSENMPFCLGENLMHLLVSVLATRTTADWSAFTGIDETTLDALVQAVLPLQVARMEDLSNYTEEALQTIFGAHAEVLH